MAINNIVLNGITHDIDVDLSSIEQLLPSNVYLECEQGGIAVAGTPYDTDYQIRTVRAKLDYPVTVTALDGYRFGVHYYTSGEISTSPYYYGWIYTSFEIPAGVWFALGITKANGGKTYTKEIDSAIALTYKLSERIDYYDSLELPSNFSGADISASQGSEIYATDVGCQFKQLEMTGIQEPSGNGIPSVENPRNYKQAGLYDTVVNLLDLPFNSGATYTDYQLYYFTTLPVASIGSGEYAVSLCTEYEQVKTAYNMNIRGYYFYNSGSAIGLSVPKSELVKHGYVAGTTSTYNNALYGYLIEHKVKIWYKSVNYNTATNVYVGIKVVTDDGMKGYALGATNRLLPFDTIDFVSGVVTRQTEVTTLTSASVTSAGKITGAYQNFYCSLPSAVNRPYSADELLCNVLPTCRVYGRLFEGIISYNSTMLEISVQTSRLTTYGWVSGDNTAQKNAFKSWIDAIDPVVVYKTASKTTEILNVDQIPFCKGKTTILGEGTFTSVFNKQITAPTVGRYSANTLLNIGKTTYDVKFVGFIPRPSSSLTTGSNQGCAYYNGILVQAWSEDVISLINYSDLTSIAEFSATIGHGDTMDFSDEFYADGDEFPLLYATSEESPAVVYVNRITRSGATLVRTLVFPASAGYHCGHVLDNLNKSIYLIGYTNNTFGTDDGHNDMIVTRWNLRNLTDNGNDTYTPELLDTFKLPFINTAQGQCLFNNYAVVASTDIPSDVSRHISSIYFIDLPAHRISDRLTDLPIELIRDENEGVAVKDDKTVIVELAGVKVYEISFK